MRPLCSPSFCFTLFFVVFSYTLYCSNKGYLIEEYFATSGIYTLKQDSTILVFGNTSSVRTINQTISHDVLHLFVYEISFKGRIINKWDILESEVSPTLEGVKKTADNGFILMARIDVGIYQSHQKALILKLSSKMDVEWTIAFDGRPNNIFENRFGDFLVFFENTPRWDDPHFAAIKRIDSNGKELSTDIIYESQVSGFTVNSTDSLNSKFNIVTWLPTIEHFKRIYYESRNLNCSIPEVENYDYKFRNDILKSAGNYVLYQINEYGETVAETCFNFKAHPLSTKFYYDQGNDMYIALGENRFFNRGKLFFLNKESFDPDNPFKNFASAQEITRIISNLSGDGTLINEVFFDTFTYSQVNYMPNYKYAMKLNDSEYLLFYSERQPNGGDSLLICKYDIFLGRIVRKGIVSELFKPNIHISKVNAIYQNDGSLLLISCLSEYGSGGFYYDLYVHFVNLDEIEWE